MLTKTIYYLFHQNCFKGVSKIEDNTQVTFRKTEKDEMGRVLIDINGK